jgi:hyperosmotically inducible protein
MSNHHAACVPAVPGAQACCLPIAFRAAFAAHRQTDHGPGKDEAMNKWIVASLISLSGMQLVGCAVTDGQSTVGQYTDDTVITAEVKAKMAEDKSVSASRISVETLQGTVQLSGFATSQVEKDRAAQIARGVSNVKNVVNNIIVRPS